MPAPRLGSRAQRFAQQYTMGSSLTWAVLTNEIDNNRPMVFLVDSDGNGTTDHFVTIVGYTDTPTQQYGCLDTWAPASTIRWCEFRPMSASYTWGVWGGWSFNVASTGPANDMFANRTAVSGSSGSASGSSAGASKEAGEPNHGGNSGGASAWWSWTAPASGTVTFGTCSSSFDTLLAVYTGASVSALTVVAQTDDGGSCSPQSQVTFTAIAGTNYKIAVDGYNGASGSVALAWTQSAADLALTSADFSPAAPTALQPGTNLGLNWHVAGPGGPADFNYANNWTPIAGKRLYVHNSQSPVCNIGWSGTPAFVVDGSSFSVSGTIVNNGANASPSYGFWVESMYGSLNVEGLFFPEGYIGGGQKYASLTPGQTASYSCSGTIPAGKAVAVIADSTDIVPETSETDNWYWYGTQPTTAGTVDLTLESASVAANCLAPNELSQSGTLQWSCQVRNYSGVDSGPVWIEAFASQTGGLDILRAGITLTVSEKISVPAYSTQTFNFNQAFNGITDGIYTVVAVVNRSGTGGPGDPYTIYNDNVRRMGRIVLHNTAAAAPNLRWSLPPTITRAGNAVYVNGTIHNNGSGTAPGFWTEVMYGTLDASGMFQRYGYCGGGQRTSSLAPGATGSFSFTGSVPTGVWAVGALIDSTDLVPESDETDNYRVTTP